MASPSTSLLSTTMDIANNTRGNQRGSLKGGKRKTNRLVTPGPEDQLSRRALYDSCPPPVQERKAANVSHAPAYQQKAVQVATPFPTAEWEFSWWCQASWQHQQRWIRSPLRKQCGEPPPSLQGPRKCSSPHRMETPNPQLQAPGRKAWGDSLPPWGAPARTGVSRCCVR